MMIGKTPFHAEDAAQIAQKVKKGIEAVHFPDSCSWPDIVRGLCKKDPYSRLPFCRGGLENVRHHRWFLEDNFDWEAHGRRSLQAPHMPDLDGPADLRNFSVKWSEDGGDDVSNHDMTGWEYGF